ncbi:protein PELOTA 1-like [Quercus lobata]|uniref:protein PELOTA 1-like n=1 Tax=Quercus lobata TaxID=97700 RepID=UPI00124755FE|nr:protein PELOTA 1-like [Quercus lobata]
MNLERSCALIKGQEIKMRYNIIETSIPQKHGLAIAGYESAFLKHVDFDVVRCAVIASPGFTKDQFHHHLLLEIKRRQLRPIIENKSQIVLVRTTSGYKWLCC